MPSAITSTSPRWTSAVRLVTFVKASTEAPESAPQVSNVTVIALLMWLTADSLTFTRSVSRPVCVIVVSSAMCVSVVTLSVTNDLAAAPLARPAVVPTMLSTPSPVLSALLVDDTVTLPAVTSESAPMRALTHVLSVSLVSAPAPAIRPPAAVMTWVSKRPVCSARRLKLPVPRWDRSTLTLPVPVASPLELIVPSEAWVLAAVAVVGAAAATPTMPPEPAVVTARLRSVATAATVRLPPSRSTSSAR